MRRLLPVIHVESRDQALRNVARAVEAGANGVFLINHSMSAPSLWSIFESVRSEHPDYWMGVNFLDLGLIEAVTWAVSTKAAVNALWTDRSFVSDRSVHPMARASWVLAQDWAGEYFGGVAFKGQKAVEDYEKAAQNANSVMHVVCTSGQATGVAADVSKVQAMCPHVSRLALASGVTPDNVEAYLPYVDDFLVATGISYSFTELDPEKTALLASQIRSFEETSEPETTS